MDEKRWAFGWWSGATLGLRNVLGKIGREKVVMLFDILRNDTLRMYDLFEEECFVFELCIGFKIF